MANIDWHSIMNQYGNRDPRDSYRGCNIEFFNAYNENKEKSLKEGRPIYDEIPSISFQWPGMDKTVRRIEPQDIQMFPEKYAAFMAGNEPVVSGTPLAEWSICPGTVVRQLQHVGFKTVEQLAAASDDIKRKLGPDGRFIKLAKDWMEAANSSQTQVAVLKDQLERERARTSRLEETLELLMQRVEANEGTDLRPERRAMTLEKSIADIDEALDDSMDDEVEAPVKRRGRPRKV